jgi:hypothetical protein
VDCKASADGYTMTSDHMLRFRGYVEQARGPLEDSGYGLRYLIVISSDFAGAGARHPFQARAAELRGSTAVELVYLRAVDLARLAASVEGQELEPATREQFGWRSALDHGLVAGEHLDQLVAVEGPA